MRFPVEKGVEVKVIQVKVLHWHIAAKAPQTVVFHGLDRGGGAKAESRTMSN